MKICLVGKYPPIEGGVSAQTYWIARGLASRGHQVHVVTNADEVEKEYRISLSEGDGSWYQPRFPATGGSVTVYNPEPFSPWAMSHIPASNPFTTKLAALATDVIRRSDCELVLAYYYEPYAVAGWMASRWTGRPLLLKHAGSDLDRLMAVPDLATAYKEVLRDAEAVITQPRLMRRFMGMGVRAERIERDVGYSLAPDVFHPSAEPLARVGRSLDGEAEFDPTVPSIGTYGKIGRTKGTFDLIAALGRLAGRARFQLLAMVGESQGEMLRPHLRAAQLASRTFVVPFLPNWRVPSFIRSCTAVCFLERDFPVAIHGPIVPREILACGTSLILSKEIADKQRYQERLVSGENVIVVDDPKDHDELCAALEAVISNPGKAEIAGKNGALLSRELEQHDTFVDEWERLLERYAKGAPRPEVGLDGPSSTLLALESTVPGLVSLVRRCQAALIEVFVASSREGLALEIAIEFCDFVATRMDPATVGDGARKLPVALRYLNARLRAACDRRGDHRASFPMADRLQGRPVSLETTGNLRPVRGNLLQIEEFEYDVSGVFLPHPPGGTPPDELEILSASPREPLLVLFQRSPNLVMRELRIDAATQELVARCTGECTTLELLESWCRDLGALEPSEQQRCSARVLDALDRLYQGRVIVFGERTPGGVWVGGPR